uniref:Uncharacterized protein n=1 Tax=Lobelia malowensis TaxID=2041132 RepID=A0A291EZB7_9ASTR|nr:hypothetical protein Lo_mal1Pt0016 [Lobelia malowensis]ATG25208.1 hypothetical protein Lo_mal1Pt0016 [Lobelia malowensis]
MVRPKFSPSRNRRIGDHMKITSAFELFFRQATAPEDCCSRDNKSYSFRLRAQNDGLDNNGLDEAEEYCEIPNPELFPQKVGEFVFYPFSEPQCPFVKPTENPLLWSMPCSRIQYCCSYRTHILNERFVESYTEGRTWAEQMVKRSRKTEDAWKLLRQLYFFQAHFYERQVREFFLFKTRKMAETEKKSWETAKKPCIHQCEQLDFFVFSRLEDLIPKMAFWQAASNYLAGKRHEFFSDGNGSVFSN